MDLDSMKYAESRSLAKESGSKANMKADKLSKAIKQHYEQEKKKDEEAQVQASVDVREEDHATSESQNDPSQQEAPSTAVFVNTRRGRGNCTKRKTLAAGADDPAESCTTPRSSVGGKKRKVSPGKDPEMNEQEPQPAATDPKDHAPAPGETEKAPKLVKGGRIPRYQGLQQKGKTVLKPITPNFKKLHEAQFNKMESIDSYIQRKTKQMETFKDPVKESKNSARATMFSPVAVSKTPAEEKRRHTLLSASKIPSKKPSGKDEGPFRPSVLSTRRVNVRFSEATLDNEFKRSSVKTPARMSPCITSSTPQKQTADAAKPAVVKTSGFSAQKTPGPFVFTGNTSATATPGTQKKPAFDSKASSSRPLTYKPHKGPKLSSYGPSLSTWCLQCQMGYRWFHFSTGKSKPFGEVNENAAGNKSSISNPWQECYKQPKLQSREDRRTKQVENRKQKKESMLGARRGLVMM